VARGYVCTKYPETLEVARATMTYCAELIAVQPCVRSEVKKLYYQGGRVSTAPTEKGKKELDLLGPAYDVKRIKNEPVQNFMQDSDRFIRVEEQVKLGNITREIAIVPEELDNFLYRLKTYWAGQLSSGGDSNNTWGKVRDQAIQEFSQLIPRFQTEIIEEILELAQDHVTRSCKETYRELLMKGPFSVSEDMRQEVNRVAVMGVVLEKFDRFNGVVTVTVVDKYGELQAHKDLTQLLLHKSSRGRQDGDEPPRAGKGRDMLTPEQTAALKKDEDDIK
jgi:transcriptional accessory protein Tex/SPT6